MPNDTWDWHLSLRLMYLPIEKHAAAITVNQLPRSLAVRRRSLEWADTLSHKTISHKPQVLAPKSSNRETLMKVNQTCQAAPTIMCFRPAFVYAYKGIPRDAFQPLSLVSDRFLINEEINYRTLKKFSATYEVFTLSTMIKTSHRRFLHWATWIYTAFSKILGFCAGNYEECRLLGCGSRRILLHPTFQRNISPPSSGWKELES
jgi:hypothetical protein